jgi:hypothetical protein
MEGAKKKQAKIQPSPASATSPARFMRRRFAPVVLPHFKSIPAENTRDF